MAQNTPRVFDSRVDKETGTEAFLTLREEGGEMSWEPYCNLTDDAVKSIRELDIILATPENKPVPRWFIDFEKRRQRGDYNEVYQRRTEAAVVRKMSMEASNTSSFTSIFDSLLNCLFWPCFALALMAAIAFLFLPGEGVTREGFDAVLEGVMHAHPTISEHDRAELSAAADRWFDSSSMDPVVVVIYVSGSSAELVEDLTWSTSAFLGQKTTVVGATAEMERAELNDVFDVTLRVGSMSTIGVREVEKLSWNAPLVLHSFAESGLSRPSKPLIWLQVARDDTLRGMECDAAIHSTLTQSWTRSGGKEENIAAIISRILQYAVCLDWE